MLYSYQKASPNNPSPGKRIPRFLKFVPIVSSALGLTVLASVIWPVVSYQVINLLSQKNQNTKLLSPAIYDSLNQETNSAPTVISDLDFTKASNWFTSSPNPIRQSQTLQIQEKSNQSNTSEYRLSIPSLKLKNLLVTVNSDDLTKSLIQYHETALPGEYGSPVVFGHSTLPQLFDEKNYLTIFSTLPTIKVGSDIIINLDSLQYTYRVSKTYEVKPNELWVLEQDYSQKTLKLITCVPPGTKLKRLVVEANLVNNN